MSINKSQLKEAAYQSGIRPPLRKNEQYFAHDVYAMELQAFERGVQWRDENPIDNKTQPPALKPLPPEQHLTDKLAPGTF